MSSIEFYDHFIAYQINSGMNDRIVTLYQRFCKNRIRNNANILEIGCGIGVLTYLLSRRKVRIEAIDISPQSIDYAAKHLVKSNLFFTAGDILTYKPKKTPFDTIIMFDVLEHIPIENHHLLFKNIQGWMSDESELLINIPNPYYILFDQRNNPQALQEIDQPVFIDHLVSVLIANSLDLVSMETHSIWVKNDYHFLLIRKRQEFREIRVSSERNIIEKIGVRIFRTWIKFKYNYPVVKQVNTVE